MRLALPRRAESRRVHLPVGMAGHSGMSVANLRDGFLRSAQPCFVYKRLGHGLFPVPGRRWRSRGFKLRSEKEGQDVFYFDAQDHGLGILAKAHHHFICAGLDARRVFQQRFRQYKFKHAKPKSECHPDTTSGAER
jgi:hypothetical protein